MSEPPVTPHSRALSQVDQGALATMLRGTAPLLALSVGCISLVFFAAGNSLGLWLGGLVIVALLGPFAALRRGSALEGAMSTAACVDPVVGAWLIAALLSGVPLGAWLSCAVLAYALAGASAGTAVGLRAARFPAGLCAAASVVPALLWLASPVWLGDRLSDAGIDRLARFHPLIAANGTLADLGVWLEHGVVYRHTVLGQDVAYALPATVWPAVTLHAALGVAGFSLAAALKSRPRQPVELG